MNKHPWVYSKKNHFALFILLCLCSWVTNVLAASYAMPGTDAGTVRRADAVVEGYFEEGGSAVIRQHNTIDEKGKMVTISMVHSVKNFVVTQVIAGENITSGDVITMDYIGGKQDEVETPPAITPPASDELLVIGLRNSGYEDYDGNPMQSVANSTLYRYTDEKNYQTIETWVKKVRSASIREYNKMIAKEWYDMGAIDKKTYEESLRGDDLEEESEAWKAQRNLGNDEFIEEDIQMEGQVLKITPSEGIKSVNTDIVSPEEPVVNRVVEQTNVETLETPASPSKLWVLVFLTALLFAGAGLIFKFQRGSTVSG